MRAYHLLLAALVVCSGSGCKWNSSPSHKAPGNPPGTTPTAPKPDMHVVTGGNPDAGTKPDAQVPPDPPNPMTPSALCTPVMMPVKQPLEWLGPETGLDQPLVDVSPDEAGNVWAASATALYVRRAGGDMFRKYGNADGLHVYKSITAVAGAGPNEVYVGLEGYESDTPLDDPQPLREVGKAEHVHLLPDGSILSTHYSNLHNDNSANYWETRSARRLLYSHCGKSAGHLFMGGNHGITHIYNDTWGDHIHVDVKEPNGSQLLGEFFALAIDPATDGLWTCGRYACGLQKWYPDPKQWVGGTYQWAFTVFSEDHGLVAPQTHREEHVAVAVGADGTAYFLSRTYGLASWGPWTNNYSTIQKRAVPGLGTPVDMVADPDGTLWIADLVQVRRWDPKTGNVTPLSLPGSDIRRLYMDTTVSPRALYVATATGVAIYRGQ